MGKTSIGSCVDGRLQRTLVTAEELELFPDDGYQYELIEGVVHRMAPASFEPSNFAARVLIEIGVYVKEGKLGEVTGADGGTRYRR